MRLLVVFWGSINQEGATRHAEAGVMSHELVEHTTNNRSPTSPPPATPTTKHYRYLPNSFVVNTVNVEGPILCLPDTWLLWDVKGFSDITPDSLALLDLIDPPPEVVIIGCGSRIRQLPPGLQKHLQARGLAVEALDTVSW